MIMLRQRLLFGCFFVVVFSFLGTTSRAGDSEYVWARSNWGALPMGNASGTMSNGYGGYYVRKNAYGNNYESRGNFRNPNGYIIPAETCPCPVNQTRNVTVAPKSMAVSQPTPVAAVQSAVVPLAPSANGQQTSQPYRLTRISTAPTR